jgi:hypothetical protein
MLVLVLFWILYSISEGYEDARYDSIYHYRAALRRIATGLVVGYTTCAVGAPPVLYICASIMLTFVFWVVFDISRNLCDGQKPLYIGKTSSIDKLLSKAPESTWIARIAIAVLSIAANWFVMDDYLIRATKLVNLWLF